MSMDVKIFVNTGEQTNTEYSVIWKTKAGIPAEQWIGAKIWKIYRILFVILLNGTEDSLRRGQEAA